MEASLLPRDEASPYQAPMMTAMRHSEQGIPLMKTPTATCALAYAVEDWRKEILVRTRDSRPPQK